MYKEWNLLINMLMSHQPSKRKSLNSIAINEAFFYD